MANRAFATDESEGPEERPARRSFRPRRKTVIVGAIVASVLIAVFVVPYLVNNGPLRNFAERQMNRHLRGYHVQIGSARALPFGLALDLRNLVLYQDANPDPPVADIQRFHASVHWRELFRGHLVGDLRIEHPRLYVDLKNFRSEQKSNVPIQKKGWQDAVMAVYPLKINDLRIANGEFTYVDTGPFKPLRLSGIGLHATTNCLRCRRRCTIACSRIISGS